MHRDGSPSENIGTHAETGRRHNATARNDAGADKQPRLSHWSERRTFHAGSLPQHMAINVLDLDITKRCNLRCAYCFKRDRVCPDATDMTLDVAVAAVDWLIAASYTASELWVNLFGGEPLLCFPLIEQLVPYARRRARSHGKSIQFGCTTNLTLIDETIAAFFRRWGMGWHCSIDGVPEVQDYQRPGPGGTGSSALAERGARQVLRDRPGAMARATVMPEMVGRMYDSVLYFEQLGFRNMGFALANENGWTSRTLAEYDSQLGSIRDHARDNWYRKGIDRQFGVLDYFIRARVAETQSIHQCGCGRGTVLIDERGDMWPCHRFDGADADSEGQGAWRLGNIFEGQFNHLMHLAFLDRDRRATLKPECSHCAVRTICAGGCAPANLTYVNTIYVQDEISCEAARIGHRHAMMLHDQLCAEDNELFAKKFHDGSYQRPGSYSPNPELNRDQS